MGRMSQRTEREAWTAFVEGREATPENKYHSQQTGKYASKHEAEVGSHLWALASRGLIRDLEEQKRVVLVPGNGKLRPVIYIADFFYRDDDGREHWLDAKGFKTQVYRLKKRMACLLLGINASQDSRWESGSTERYPLVSPRQIGTSPNLDQFGTRPSHPIPYLHNLAR